MRVDVFRALGAGIVAAIWASTPAALTAQVAATSVLRGEWLVERGSAEVFAAARDTMRAMGCGCSARTAKPACS